MKFRLKYMHISYRGTAISRFQSHSQKKMKLCFFFLLPAEIDYFPSIFWSVNSHVINSCLEATFCAGEGKKGPRHKKGSACNLQVESLLERMGTALGCQFS